MFQKLNIDNEKDLNQIYLIGNALASPIRVAILSQLKTGEKSVTELAKINLVSVSSILFHLDLLAFPFLQCLSLLFSTVTIFTCGR